MKARKIVLAVLLSLILIVSAVIAVACKPDEEDNGGVVKIDMSKAADWDPLDDTETAYVIRTNSDGKLQLDYTTSNYQFVKRVFVEPVEDYQKVKKLVAKVKMTSNQSEPQLLFKVEGDDTTVEYPEVTVNVTGEYKTYEWNFAKFSNADPYDLTKAARLLICADPGDANAEGSIVFEELYMSSEDIVEANRVALPHKPVVEDYTWNEITATKTSVTEWTPDANGVYTITKSGTTVKASVNKDKVDGDEYTAMIGYIYGDALKTMKSFKIDIKGPSGKTALVKPLDYKDFKVTFDGTVQHFEFDISEQASRSDANFAQSANPQADNKVAILVLNGLNAGKADIEISSASFSTEAAVVDEETTEQVNEITATETTANKGWYDLGDNAYTITKNADNTYNVVFDKKGHEYATMYALVKGAALSTMKSVKLTVVGTAGTHLTFKPFDDNNYQSNFTLKGGEETFSVDISENVKNKDVNSELKVCIIAESGNKTATGEFTIKNLQFSTEEASGPVDPSTLVNEITDTNRKITQGWHGLDVGVYEITADGTAFNVHYKKTSDYNFLRVWVKGNAIANMKSVTFTISGTAGKTILLKPFDSNDLQKTPTFSGNEDKVTIDISSYVAGKTFADKVPFLIAIEPGIATNPEGDFRIISVEFSTEAAPVTKVENNITVDERSVSAGWYDKQDGVYKVEKQQDGSFKVTFDKKGFEYPMLHALVKGGDIAKMKSIKFVVKGTAGLKLIFKPFNQSKPMETEVTLEGTEAGETFVVDISSYVNEKTFATAEDILICAAGGDKTAKGEFTILSAEFSTKADGSAPDYNTNYKEITHESLDVSKWQPASGAESVYKVEEKDGGVDVTVTKSAGMQYVALQSYIWGDHLKNVKTFRIVINGDSGTKLLLKPFNENTPFVLPELEVTLDGTDQTFDVYVDSWAKQADRNFKQRVNFAHENLICILGLPGAETGTQHFTIKSATFIDTDEVTTITDANKAVTSRYYSGDPVYSFKKVAEGVEVSYSKGAFEWPSVRALVTGDAIKTYNKVVFKIKATAEFVCTFKPFDNNDIQLADQKVEVGEHEYTVDYSTIKNNLDTTSNLSILLFVEGGKANVTGSFIIESITFTA